MWSRSLRVSPEKAQLVIEAFQRSAFSSQQGLATELGFSRSTVSKFFNGKAVDRLIFIEICEKLRLDWQAIVDTKQTDKETSMSESKLKQKYPNLPVAVILTAIKEETTAVLHHLGGADQTENEEGYFCREFRENGQNWLVAVQEIGQFTLNACSKTKDALNFWQPQVILFAGIAGSLRVDNADLGDVVAANLVSCYEHGKIDKNGMHSRQQVVFEGSSNLIKLAKNLNQHNSWQNRIECGFPEKKPQSVVEPIVSGDKLIADINNEFYGYLRHHFSASVAVEMEGYGFHYGVAEYDRERSGRKVDALVIRSISDLIHNQTDEKNPDRKVIAARHASAFAFEILAKFKINNDPASRSNSDRQHSRIKENLTEKTRPKLFGREQDQSDLMEYLSEEHSASIITVAGIGGVGKTALVLKVAYRCLEASQCEDETVTGIPKFEAIIFVSAKERELQSGGIVNLDEPARTLYDIFQVIADTLNDSINQEISEPDQRKRVKEMLRKQRTLLIVDNLESVANKEEIITFLFNLPRTVKSVITTRDGETLFSPISLKELPKEDSLDLIKQQIKLKKLSESLSEEDVNKIFLATKGIPLVIVYAIGILANSGDLDRLIKILEDPDGDLAKCLFKVAVEELKKTDQPAYKLLMSLAIFPFPAITEAVVEVAGLKVEIDDVWQKGFTRLKQLSFVYQQRYNNRYEMLSLTRKYALAQLRDHANKAFSEQAQEIRVKWGLKFATQYGGEDWRDWHFQYKYIEEEWGNLVATLEWCSQQPTRKYYDYFRDLWKELNRFANIYGYWRERLRCLDWLEKASIDRNEFQTAVYAMAKQGWTLTLKGRPQDLTNAEKIFTKAWNFRNHAEPGDLIYLANHFAALCIRQEQLKPIEQRQYKDATKWLNEASDMYQKFCTDYSDKKEQELTRLRLRIPYYEAQIHYYQGDYPKAKELLEEVHKDADATEWQRVLVDAKNWLADVLIKQVELVNNLEEADNLLKEAEDYLTVALEVAKSNQNKRRVALCQRSYARLESARPEQERNPVEIRKWAKEAIKGFEEGELEMTKEANEMRTLINSLG